MKVLKDVLKQNIAAFLVWGTVTLVNFAVFRLYGLVSEPFLYSSALSLFFLLLFLAVEAAKEKKRASERAFVLSSLPADLPDLPAAHSAAEEDYSEMVAVLGRRLETLAAGFDEEKRGMLDYYTAWVHQIKTPIAVMKLKLAADTEENRALRQELFRIEQYADMALQYIRLGSESNDLVIREYDLDEVIRESVRKFAPHFVGKKLRLEYDPVNMTVVTDRKWFSCILDQLISNAVKYTSSGTITISAADGVLSVADTGIGIAAEDLPRIFEKGFTGSNGRIGEKSSGLGLYLAKKAADLLAVPIRAESVAGAGSRFLLDLREKTTERK